MSTQQLDRKLNYLKMITLAAGAVIGGWLTEAPYWFSLTGGGAAFLFPLLAIMLVPVGLAFGELTALLPFSSTVGVWTSNAMGPKAGWYSQWLLFLIQVVQPPMMAYIFVTAINFFIPLDPTQTKLAALGIIVLWYILSNFNISVVGSLANVLFFIMIGVAMIVLFSFFTSGHWKIANITQHGGWFPNGFKGISVALAVFALKFIGFEMTPTLVEEVNFPVKQVWKVILCALFIPAALYCVAVLAFAGMLPWAEFAQMSMPEPEIVALYNLPAFVGYAAITAGILFAITTIMGFWASSARVLYGAAKLNQLPKQLAKLNKTSQPAMANFVVLIFASFFVLATDSSNWVQYIYTVSCVAAGFIYFLVCLDAMILRKKRPDWERPYKVPCGNLMFVLGMLVGGWIVIGSCLEMPIGGYYAIAIYMAAGVGIDIAMGIIRKKDPQGSAVVILTPGDADRI